MSNYNIHHFQQMMNSALNNVLSNFCRDMLLEREKELKNKMNKYQVSKQTQAIYNSGTLEDIKRIERFFDYRLELLPEQFTLEAAKKSIKHSLLYLGYIKKEYQEDDEFIKIFIEQLTQLGDDSMWMRHLIKKLLPVAKGTAIITFLKLQ